jgi:DNA-binding transcriptional ArsR family regulator
MKIESVSIEQLETASNMLKAIAHPMRIAILQKLEDGKKLTVTEIHESINIDQSTASHHLGILKDKGVLASKREGKNTYYFLKSTAFTKLIDCISNCANCY